MALSVLLPLLYSAAVVRSMRDCFISVHTHLALFISFRHILSFFQLLYMSVVLLAPALALEAGEYTFILQA